MLAYEFYSCDGINRHHLIGILPERRRNPERITEGSIMGWVRKVLGNDTDVNNVTFIKVTLDEGKNKNL